MSKESKKFEQQLIEAGRKAANSSGVINYALVSLDDAIKLGADITISKDGVYHIGELAPGWSVLSDEDGTCLQYIKPEAK